MRRVLTFLAAVALTGCAAEAGTPRPTTTATPPVRTASVAAAPTWPKSHPQAIEPVAGAGSPGAASRPPAPPSPVSVGPPAAGQNLARPLSDAAVRAELASSGLTASPNQAALTPDGLAVAPIDAPAAVQQVIRAGNEIAHLPYVWGGGHTTFEDTGYDCSGSISFAFGAAHLLSGAVASGSLMSYGDAGPGRWITVFANPGHTFMYVAGLRFDTVALAETGSRWSSRPANEPDLRTFAVRHPRGM